MFNGELSDNDSSFSSVSQQENKKQVPVMAKPVNQVVPFSETILNETITEQKKVLKLTNIPDLAKIKAEEEAAKKQLQSRRKRIGMKKIDESAKMLLKATKKSKDLFGTVFDDLPALEAAADERARSGDGFNTILGETEEFIN